MSQTDSKARRSLALFPASFDPPTNGHIDLIVRSRSIFDEVIVALARNVSKSATFSTEERIEMLETITADMDGVHVHTFEGLVVNYAREIGARSIIRGLRAVQDFEYEFEMALMNKHLASEIEILFLMSNLEYMYVSSSRLKELVRFGAGVEDFVPPVVAKALKAKLG